MDLLHAVLQVYKSSDLHAAFQAMVDSLSAQFPLRCAVWVGESHAGPLCAHPADAEIPPELLSMAAHVARPEVFPVAALSPAASVRYPGAEMLLLPLRTEAPAGAVLLIGEPGVFGEDLEAWAELGEALGSTAARLQCLREAHEEREAHRKRAQEMEALDVLGLAANQTLDPDAVLALVARFTRTLLGAHYAVVNIAEEGGVRASSAVGFRTGSPAGDDDPFALRVIESGKPIVLGEGGEPFDPRELPLHEAQGMRVGLGVPLSLFGETFGALVVGYRDPYPTTARDTLLALTLARHAAVAINNARLHAALAERSQELERAYAELHELSHLKERFFASMSHELRTPLNGILGFQTLLLEGAGGELSSTGRAYLEKSNRAARNLLHLVDDILDYAKIEAGKMELLVRPVTLHELLEDAVCSVEPLIAQKGLRLVGSSVEADEPLHTDPDRVRQILLNLLSNAIKFTEAGEITLDVLDVRDGGAEGWVEIRVRDSGPGIAEGDRETIFREFEQVKGTKGGTGLGLPISRKLARLLGGELYVESEVGAGSTFILRLPAQASAGAGLEVPSGVA